MKRLAAISALALAIALLAGGWFFRATVRSLPADYQATVGGAYEVSVTSVAGTADEVAADAARRYAEAGWQQLPVSTATFRVFARGKRTAALLAEDTPSGVRLTELKRK